MSTVQGTSESPSLKDFLRAKADEYGVRDRIRRRKEWLDAVRRLYDRLEAWMREADPDGLLDVVPYEVQRGEPGLGTYDAPALLVRFGPAEVFIEPMTSGPSRFGLDPDDAGEAGPRFRGRVDVSDGERKYNFLRAADVPDEWWIQNGGRREKLERGRFEAVVKELLA